MERPDEGLFFTNGAPWDIRKNQQSSDESESLGPLTLSWISWFLMDLLNVGSLLWCSLFWGLGAARQLTNCFTDRYLIFCCCPKTEVAAENVENGKRKISPNPAPITNVWLQLHISSPLPSADSFVVVDTGDIVPCFFSLNIIWFSFMSNEIWYEVLLTVFFLERPSLQGLVSIF